LVGKARAAANRWGAVGWRSAGCRGLCGALRQGCARTSHGRARRRDPGQRGLGSGRVVVRRRVIKQRGSPGTIAGCGPMPPSRQAGAPVSSSFERFASIAGEGSHCERCDRCAGTAGTTCGRQRDADESTPKYMTSGCRGGGIRLASRARNCTGSSSRCVCFGLRGYFTSYAIL